MNHNRKRREAKDRERRRREAALRNALPVDPTALAPSPFAVPPEFVRRGYYLDFPFVCVSCGAESVWTAAQQKWWYETAKGSPDSTAKHCRVCRRDARREKGTAHPLRDYRGWLGPVRDALEPALLAAGWYPVVGVGEARPTLFSYLREGVVVRFRWSESCEGSALILERRAGLDAPFQTLVQVECHTRDMTQAELQRRFDGFLTAAQRELRGDACDADRT